MRLTWSVLLLSAGVLPVNCADTNLPPKVLAAAKKIYTSKCARCHEIYEPGAYGDAEWSRWMTKMIRKSRLNKEQAELLARYTDSLREQAKQTSSETKRAR